MEEFLCHLQSEASLYGLLLNLEKTVLLNHPKRITPPPSFIDGTEVKTNDRAKYLGSLISWHKPTLAALLDRNSRANTESDKLTNLWGGNLPRKVKTQIFAANIMLVLLHGAAPLSMEKKHLQNIDSWFFSHLRRVLGIKVSYYSQVSVWEQAHRPILPSQLVLPAQFRRRLHSLNAAPHEPMHHVALAPGHKDRVACQKHFKTGPPPPHWSSLVFGHAMEYYLHFIVADPTYHRSIHGFELLITKCNEQFPAKLLASPTRQSYDFSLY